MFIVAVLVLQLDTHRPLRVNAPNAGGGLPEELIVARSDIIWRSPQVSASALSVDHRKVPVGASASRDHSIGNSRSAIDDEQRQIGIEVEQRGIQKDVILCDYGAGKQPV